MRAMAIDPHAAPLSVPARPELTGGRRIGVLLSHGFTGSPYSMRGWGESLAERGYAVEVPRLPGHGTTWQEANKTTWEDWYAEITRVFGALRAANDAVVVGGLSMGGGLVLRLAADRSDEIAGVVVVNPAVNSDRKDILLLPLLKHLVPSMPGIVNDIKLPGQDEHGYPKTPLRAADSMFRGYKALRADLARITTPVLLFRSAEDHVVDPSSARIIASSISSRDFTERMLADSFHVATLDNDAETIRTESAAFIERVTVVETA
jgi:carboxylesterase